MFEILIENINALQNTDVFKILMSSAEHFPGMYKISLDHQPFLANSSYLKLINVYEMLINHKLESIPFRQLLSAQELQHLYIFEKSNRNTKRKDNEMKELLPQKNQAWLNTLSKLNLCVVDNVLPISHIECDRTYYMMGSLIRFKKDAVLVGYNHYLDQTALKLSIDFTFAEKYLESIYKPDDLEKLFMKAEVIGQLSPSESGFCLLKCHFENLNTLLAEFHPNSLVMGASARDENPLPIDFAKPVLLSNPFA